ncbi:unnamed protein product [Chilo suppressalis]|uniref:HAT C-terminal dimerisation domain-containing protein n=1 Tax=Chilo suppressalis TaxID=168631 RepID=A0ABN8BAJ3_CHISP|nr:unnamed protein product [Chilo suppressalis]
MSKRKCKFTEVLRAKYPCFTKGRDDFDAKCSICDCHVDVSNKGTIALERHVTTEKHKKMIRAASSSSKVTNYFQSPYSMTHRNIHAAEGVLAFHTVKHHQSYNSMTCTASLTRKMFTDSETAKNLKCGKTKTEAIINQVVAPHAITTIIETLKNISCLSVATDASNHGAEKLFPIMIQYFNWTGNGIETKLLDLQSLPNETSLSIAHLVYETLNTHQLTPKCVAFIGDNANVNFGGINRNPGQNVFTRLKESLKKENLIGIGCPAHIMHNSLRHGVDLMKLDVESIILKIFNYFSVYTVRTEALKEFCDYVELNYQPLLRHSKTRWLSLFPCIERILKLYPALKEYFLSQRISPYIIKTFFESSTSEAYLWFTHSLMSIYQANLAKVEEEHNSLLEISKILQSVLRMLQNRRNDKFLPLRVRQLLRDNCGENEEAESISNEFFSVYEACENYLKEWIKPFDDFKCFEWMTVLKENENLKYEALVPCIEFLSIRGVEIDDAKLHDQFCSFISFLKSKSDGDSADKYYDLKLYEQWTMYFKSAKNIEYFSELLKICEFYFSISAHNANVERVFSLINTQWTKERNRLSVESVKALILTQYNFKNMSCEDFYNYLLKNQELLTKIGSSAKYDD